MALRDHSLDDKITTAAGEDFLQGLKASMQHESAAILHLIFRHYEEALLLLCRSTGSSLEHYFDDIVQNKIGESIAFFRQKGIADIDETLLGLLIAAQFDSYRRIVMECSDRKSAEKYMDALMTYHFGGWVAFHHLLKISRTFHHGNCTQLTLAMFFIIKTWPGNG